MVSLMMSKYSMTAFETCAACFITTGSLMTFFILNTPKHDKLRSIKAATTEVSTTTGREIDPVEVQRALQQHNKLKNAVVFLWMTLFILYGTRLHVSELSDLAFFCCYNKFPIDMTFAGIVQSGSLHINTYTTEYLGLSMASGPYLIALYEFGNVTLCMAVILAPKSIKLIIDTTDFMMLYLFIMTLSIAGLILLWLFIPLQFKVITIYIVFPMVGFLIGMYYPRKMCG